MIRTPTILSCYTGTLPEDVLPQIKEREKAMGHIYAVLLWDRALTEEETHLVTCFYIGRYFPWYVRLHLRIKRLLKKPLSPPSH